MQGKEGFFYILRAENTNYFKVGFASRDAEVRRKACQTGNHLQLKIYVIIPDEEALDVETRFKRLLQPYRTKGGEEWFNVEQSVLDQLLTQEKQGYYGETWYSRQENEKSEIGRLYADHVRQVCRGQQDAVACRGKNVLRTGNKPTVFTGDQYQIVPECEEHDLSRQANRRQKLQEFSGRAVELHDD